MKMKKGFEWLINTFDVWNPNLENLGIRVQEWHIFLFYLEWVLCSLQTLEMQFHFSIDLSVWMTDCRHPILKTCWSFLIHLPVILSLMVILNKYSKIPQLFLSLPVCCKCAHTVSEFKTWNDDWCHVTVFVS